MRAAREPLTRGVPNDDFIRGTVVRYRHKKDQPRLATLDATIILQAVMRKDIMQCASCTLRPLPVAHPFLSRPSYWRMADGVWRIVTETRRPFCSDDDSKDEVRLRGWDT